MPSEELCAEAQKAALGIAELSDTAYQGTIRSVWGRTIERMTVLVEEQTSRRDAARGR
jgi:hypothetical protein